MFYYSFNIFLWSFFNIIFPSYVVFQDHILVSFPQLGYYYGKNWFFNKIRVSEISNRRMLDLFSLRNPIGNRESVNMCVITKSKDVF